MATVNARRTPKTERRAPAKAAPVEVEDKRASIRRLARIEGQVRGLMRMLEEGRSSGEVLIQVSSVQQALRSVAREQLHSQARAALRGSYTADKADQVIGDMLEHAFRHAR
ncbi:MAG: metal-sensitive transcriptional regulator [Polyangiaceae bacterium]|nr:metal-sensitive transcriptional regulator [Polyangiaceae bacterium]